MKASIHTEVRWFQIQRTGFDAQKPKADLDFVQSSVVQARYQWYSDPLIIFKLTDSTKSEVISKR